MKKRIAMAVVIIGMAGILFLILYSRPYDPSSEQIAFRVYMHTDEDIGLLVYDYQINDHMYSGGISNADRSMIRKDSDDNYIVLNRTELDDAEEPVHVKLSFRIITEYTDPNFENIYPEEITESIAPMDLTVSYGQMINLYITGNRDDGYQSGMKKPE